MGVGLRMAIEARESTSHLETPSEANDATDGTFSVVIVSDVVAMVGPVPGTIGQYSRDDRTLVLNIPGTIGGFFSIFPGR